MLSDSQRDRAMMLAIFEAPHNLPLAVLAKLAGKSRPPPRSIERSKIDALYPWSWEIEGNGQRIPDWQLEPARQEFIQSVLQHEPCPDG
jgi:hypothetical protein